MKGDVLFKIAVVLVLLMSVVLIGVIFAVLIIGMPGWYAACYGIVYCCGTGFMAEKFILPKMGDNSEKSEDNGGEQ